MVDRLQRLRHYAVVGRHHDHHDVGDLGAARAHPRKGFVTWRIQENDLSPERRRIRLGDLHLVGADVLRDPARFAARHVRFADRIQQRRLSVIDVPHYRYHRRPRDFQLIGILGGEDVLHGLIGHLILEADHLHVGPELRRDFLDQLAIQRLVHRDKHALHQQRRNQILAADCQLLRQILHAHAFCHRDGARDLHRSCGDLRYHA